MFKKSLLFLVVVAAAGCTSQQPPPAAAPAPVVSKEQPKGHAYIIDFRGKEEYTTKGSFGNDSVTIHCTSSVAKKGDGFVYKWKIHNGGKAKCLARWEIFDHMMSKMPYLFEIEPDKDYELTHESKEPPAYVWRTATCFQKNNKIGDWEEFMTRHSVSISKDDFWHSTQVAQPCVAPKNVLIPQRDFKN